VLKKLFPQMTKQKGATEAFNTGVDTFSTTKHSFVNRLKFWKVGHNKSLASPCEGCRSWKIRLDPENEASTNLLRGRSLNQERQTHERAERMMEASETSISRTAPIPIPGATNLSRGCCPRKGKENQQNGNVNIDVKDTAFLNTSSMPDGIVNITVVDSQVLSTCHFAKNEDSLPENGHLPSPERDCFPIDEEYMSDLVLSPVGLRCTGSSPDLLHVLNDMDSLASLELVCPAGLDLEAELKEAMESSLPCPEIESETTSSPAAPTLETAKSEAEGSEISLTESFSRTRSSLSSHGGNSAPSNSFHIEQPYSHLGSDFVDVEDYFANPSTSLSQATYPALDSSATTEDFGFKPTCERRPGSWPSPNEMSAGTFLPDEPPISRRWEDMPPNAVRLLTTDLGGPRGFIMSKEKVMRVLEKKLPPKRDTALSFWRCRPIPDATRESSLSPSPLPSTSDSGSTTSIHLRGGGDEARYSLFRSAGRGRLVGNVERGKKVLDEPASGTYVIGYWGRNEAWREFCVKMEKRVEQRKKIEILEMEIEKLKAEKASEGGVGMFKEMATNVKGWFVSGKGEEECELETKKS
jgi:hypothetical protein